MIQGTVTGDKEVSRRLRALPDGIRSRVTESIGRLTLLLQAKVVRDKLSGQVLNVRTGTLRRSIDQRLVSDGEAVTGIVSTNLKYAKAHEYGSNQPVTVREHLRLVKKAFGKDLKTPVWATVKAHSAKQNLPERSFLRTALADMKPEILAGIDKAVAEGIKK
jgi:phage gpG-like protein